MAALEWITVKGFRSIRSIEKLKLQSINVIIGSNGSGKSNFISTFALLNSIRQGQLAEYVARSGGANNILHFGQKETKSLYLRLSFDNDVNGYDITLIPTADDELRPLTETVYYWDKSRYADPLDRGIVTRGQEAGISGQRPDAISRYVQHHLERWRLYHFHDTSASSPMKQNAEVGDNRHLRSDASNIAPFLFMLREGFRASYDLIVAVVQKVAPFFEDFVLRPLVLNEDKIRLEWKHRSTDAYFGPSALSDGSLRFIALATLLMQPAILRPSVILIDEPELGLHPYALAMLANMMRQASQHTQLLISTQSALLLDHFEPSEVLVADRTDNSTTLKRLVDAELNEWLEEYSLGQLWEKAEFGGRPGSQQ